MTTKASTLTEPIALLPVFPCYYSRLSHFISEFAEKASASKVKDKHNNKKVSPIQTVHTDSVEDGEKLIQSALDAFGKIGEF